MKKSKQFKALTSVILGTSIMFGGTVSPVLAANNGAVNDNVTIRAWDGQDDLIQKDKIIYEKGDIAIYNCKLYKCKRFHYAQPGWNPCDAPMFWKPMNTIPNWSVDDKLTQENKAPYEKGDLVIYDSKLYKCKRFHYAQSGWNPCDAPMFWKLVK